MSHSDYLFLKNKYETLTIHSSSSYTKKKQLKNIQTTIIINEDNEWVENKRFNIPIKNSITIKTTKNNKYLTMYSIPRIQVNEYIKNRYEPPFCWTCNTPIDDLLNNISCDICDNLESSLEDSSKYEPLFEIADSDFWKDYYTHNLNIAK